MKEPRELELKYHLEEKSDYALMVEGCPPAHGLPPVKQENHYFDSARYDLARRGGMLRLRFDGNLTLGFKLGSEQPGCPGFFDALEVECPTDPGLLQRALKDPRVLSEL